MRFITAVNESVFATSQGVGTKSIAEIEYRTGSLLQSWEGVEGERKEQELLRTDSTDEWFGVPSLVSNPADLSPWIAHVLRGGSGTRELVGPLEALDHNGQVLVLCSHERLAGGDKRPAGINTVLRVIDQRSGAVLLEDIVNTNVSGPIPESFLVYHETLYYVKERKELVAVRLAGAEREGH